MTEAAAARSRGIDIEAQRLTERELEVVRMAEAFTVDDGLRATDQLRDWQAADAAWRLCRRHHGRSAGRVA